MQGPMTDRPEQLQIEAERVRTLFPRWTEDQVRSYAEKVVDLETAVHEYTEARTAERRAQTEVHAREAMSAVLAHLKNRSLDL